MDIRQHAVRAAQQQRRAARRGQQHGWRNHARKAGRTGGGLDVLLHGHADDAVGGRRARPRARCERHGAGE